MLISRRSFLASSAITAAIAVAGDVKANGTAPKTIRVTIWDERQLAQKVAYPNFLGNWIADYLKGKPEFEVVSVGLEEAEQGLPISLLDKTDVLIWWGHQKHDQVKDALVEEIIARLKAGKLALLALHSAHFSKPFTRAMEERTLQDAERSLRPNERGKVKIVVLKADRTLVPKNERLTPWMERKLDASGQPILEVKLPGCAFTSVRGDGKPAHVTVLDPKHPIMKNVPATFDIPKTEMYEDPFHVPPPEATLILEKWDLGETFHSGCVWSVGKGIVFYYRPGHETFPVFKQQENLTIVENAIKFLAGKLPKR